MRGHERARRLGVATESPSTPSHRRSRRRAPIGCAAHVGDVGAAMMEAHLPSVMPIAGSLGPGKLGDPVADLGPMIVFLAGNGARFITGQLLAVDGGIMM